MQKTAVVIILIIALLTSVQLPTIKLSSAQSMPPPSQLITIRSDGSLDPASAPINKTGNLYTLTKDLINYTLIIQCSNITFDGADHTLHGKGISMAL